MKRAFEISVLTIASLLCASTTRAEPAELPAALGPEQLDASMALPGALAPLSPVVAPRNNPQTPAKVALGRRLFHENKISGDGASSCASCHMPERGFGDGKPRASGFGGATLARNTPTIWNAAHNARQFWDGRAATLEAQALGPILAPAEMNGGSERAIVARLSSDPRYSSEFRTVFGGGGITLARIAKALAAFERTLVTHETPYDRWLLGDKNAMTLAEKRGLAVFVGKGACTACHTGANLSDGKYHNLGAMPDAVADLGRAAVSKKPGERGAFRTPSLRNVALTAPYGHAGNFQTLESLIEFYDQGGGTGPKSELLIKLELSADEKADLAAFLRALSDEEGAALAANGPAYESLDELMKDGLHEPFTQMSFTIWHDAPLTPEKFDAVAASASRIHLAASHILALKGSAWLRRVPSGQQAFANKVERLSGLAQRIQETASARDEQKTVSYFLHLEETCEGCHLQFRPDLVGQEHTD